jgi:hypothetical protein
MTMNFRRIVLTAIFLVAVGSAGFAWFRFIAHPKPVACGYCSRPLHTRLSVTAEIDGKQTEVCCARCAIAEANQQQRPLKLVAVHDYLSGRSMSPAEAWFVEGSHTMACDHDAMRMNEMKGTEELAFDRCSPGTLAFAEKQDAEAFVRANGGTVLSATQLMSEVRFQ